MRSLIQSVVVAAAMILPIASFAQSMSPVTRAQVRAELVQLEKVGYHVGDGDQAHYPDALMAAEARVSTNGDTAGYSGVSTVSQPGGSVSTADWNAMYSR